MLHLSRNGIVSNSSEQVVAEHATKLARTNARATPKTNGRNFMKPRQPKNGMR
jgi:hypothetical protein